MRKLVLIAVFAATSSARAAEHDCACFSPTQDQIVEFESRVTELPEPIYSYARYYSGRRSSTASGKMQSWIEAQFVPVTASRVSGIQIVDRLPALKEEGCIASIGVPPPDNVFQIFPRCNRPGGWTPSAADIDELERRIALPRGTAPLARYQRHYAGVIEAGMRIIKGAFVASPNAQPGIVIGSEVELPVVGADDCLTVAVAFNPQTKLSSVRCGEID